MVHPLEHGSSLLGRLLLGFPHQACSLEGPEGVHPGLGDPQEGADELGARGAARCRVARAPTLSAGPLTLQASFAMCRPLVERLGVCSSALDSELRCWPCLVLDC